MFMARKLCQGVPAGAPLRAAQGILPAICLVLSIGAAHAEGNELGAFKLPEQIEFKGLPAAPQFATLFGDPAKEGFYVVRVKFPAGLKLMPHTHPDAPRTVAVLSGTLYFAFGETWDESKLKAFPAGTFFSEPPNTATMRGPRTGR
jgi:quercetin dioxygenase-like cupin family protein